MPALDVGCLVPACVVSWLGVPFLAPFNEGNVELGANGFSDIIKGGDWLRAKGSLQKFPTKKKARSGNLERVCLQTKSNIRACSRGGLFLSLD